MQEAHRTRGEMLQKGTGGNKVLLCKFLSSQLLAVFPIEQISPEHPCAKEPDEEWHLTYKGKPRAGGGCSLANGGFF